MVNKNAGFFTIRCSAKVNAADDWEYRIRGKGILRFAPDIFQTAPTVFTAPAKLESVQKRLEGILLENSPSHSDVPPGWCGENHLARGTQEAEKTHVAPLAAHRSYELEHGTAEGSLT